MRKDIAFVLLFLTFFSFARASTLVVDSSANGSSNCEGTSSSYLTIKSAVTAASNGDTISICPGTYNEDDIWITKDNLTIEGYSGNRDDVNVSGGDWIFGIEAKNATFKNLTIEDTGNGYGIKDGYGASGSHTFENLVVSSADNAIYLQYPSTASIFKNLSITSSGGSGIQTNWNSAGAHSFSDINITAKKYGIYATRGAGSFSNVNINAGDNAIYMGSAYPATFDDMNLTSTGAKGIYILNNVTNSNNYIISNTTINSKGISIDIAISGKDIIKDSNITSTSDKGIYLESSADGAHELSNLNLTSSGIGINAVEGVGILNNMTLSSSAKDGISIGNKYPITASHINVIQAGAIAFLINKQTGTSNDYTFNDINLTSTNEAFKVAKSGKITIDGMHATSANSDAISFTNDAQGAHEISNATLIAKNGSGILANHGIGSLTDFNITAKSYGVKAPDYEDAKIQRGFITTTSDKAIYVGSGNNKTLLVQDVVISSGNNAIQLDQSSSATINRVCVNKSVIGMRAKWNAENVTIKNSKFDGNSDTGVQIASDSSYPATVTNSCFLKTNFATRNNAAHTFNGNYWDGTPPNGFDNAPLSSCPITSCYSGTPLIPTPIANYQMDECSWDGTTGEVKNSSDNHYDGTAKKGANTETNSSVGGGICHVGEFDGSDYVEQNNIYDILKTTASLSFWIKTTQSGDDTMWEAPGVTGIEQEGGGNDIFWGWIDASGHIGILKGNTAGAQSTTAINDNTWHHIVLTRDSSSGDTEVYVDGNIENSATSATGDVGNSFNRIGSIEDTGGTPTYFKGYLDEVEIYDSVLSSTNVKDIYDNEKDKKNYDGSERTCQQCGGNENNNATTLFNAVSSIGGTTCNAVNDWDNNITTQIVNKSYGLYILSKDAQTQTMPSEADITKVELKYYDDGNTTDCKGNLLKSVIKCDDTTNTTCDDTNTNGCAYYNNMTIDRAVKCVQVYIEGKDKNNTSTDTNSSFSNDDYAVRPQIFSINVTTSPLVAGADFNTTFQALDVNGNATSDYNETKDDSFAVDANITKSTCNLGDFNMSSFSFANGQKSDVNASYSEVGDLNITIKEKSGSEYAEIDADDTPDAQRFIEQNSTVVTFIPYQFSIINYTFSRNNPDADWRYMTDVNDSNISISYKVQAQNSDGNVTKNFDKQCYDNNVSTIIGFNFTSSDDVNISYYRDINNTPSYGHDINISDINWTDTISYQNFTDGNSSKIVYALNVYRKKNKLKNPLDINVTDINTSDANAINIGLIPDNNGSTFYYGRVKTYDVSTNKKDINSSLEVEVYDTNNGDNFVNGFHQNSLNWYVMKNDNNSVITDLNDSSEFTTIADTDLSVTNLNYANGVLYFDLNNPNEVKKAFVHVNIPKYLWYSKYNDYNATGDCSEHPCFRYNYNAIGLSNNVHSGDFNGSSIGTDFNATNTKRGVKTFR